MQIDNVGGFFFVSFTYLLLVTIAVREVLRAFFLPAASVCILEDASSKWYFMVKPDRPPLGSRMGHTGQQLRNR
jgi:hypothetical protein